MEKRIIKKLKSLGLSTGQRGYAYLVAAIRLCFERPSYLEQPIKYLYIKIGRHYNVQEKDIERSIRCLITLLLESENGHQIRDILGERSFYSREYITNKTVIFCLIEAIKSDTSDYT